MGLQDKKKKTTANNGSIFKTNAQTVKNKDVFGQKNVLDNKRKGAMPAPGSHSKKSENKEQQNPGQKVRKVGIIQEPDDYFERMLSNSSNVELSNKIREDIELSE
ncbi:MAG: hypothetical protein K6G03_00200, partial [Lachnospiraceae bacterium]|nr:hypothetical protein [Lachnospiraceae bacterium]